MLFYHLNDFFFSRLIKSSRWHCLFPFTSIYPSHIWWGWNIWRIGGFLIDSANSLCVDRYWYVWTISFLGRRNEHFVTLTFFDILWAWNRVQYLVYVRTVALRWLELFLLRTVKSLPLFILATHRYFAQIVTHQILIWMYLLVLRRNRFVHVIRLFLHLATVGPLYFFLDQSKLLREISNPFIWHFWLNGLNREIRWDIIPG